MVCYYNGDINKGGFRFLHGDTICADFFPENEPIDAYLQNLVKFVNQNKINKIFICARNYSKTTDISFLRELSGIESVQISAICKDLSPLLSLKPKVLKIQIQNESIDFSSLQDSLQELDLYELNPWSGRIAQISESLLQCKKITKFGVSCFNSNDFSILEKMTWLNELGLAQARDKKISLNRLGTLQNLQKISLESVKLRDLDFALMPNISEIVLRQSNINSLNGIQNLKNLNFAEIDYCPKLTDVSAIVECARLTKLKFESVKHIENIAVLTSLKELQWLALINCGKIASLSFVSEMSSLRYLNFYDTNISDGDLTPCLKLENVITADKRHYNIKAKDLPRK